MNKNMDTTDIENPEITREQICCKCHVPSDVIILQCGHPMHPKCIAKSLTNLCPACDNVLDYSQSHNPSDIDKVSREIKKWKYKKDMKCSLTYYIFLLIIGILLFLSSYYYNRIIENAKQRKKNDITYTCNITQVEEYNKKKYSIYYEIFNNNTSLGKYTVKRKKKQIDKYKQNITDLQEGKTDGFRIKCWAIKNKYFKAVFDSKLPSYYYYTKSEGDWEFLLIWIMFFCSLSCFFICLFCCMFLCKNNLI